VHRKALGRVDIGRDLIIDLNTVAARVRGNTQRIDRWFKSK